MDNIKNYSLIDHFFFAYYHVINIITMYSHISLSINLFSFKLLRFFLFRYLYAYPYIEYVMNFLINSNLRKEFIFTKLNPQINRKIPKLRNQITLNTMILVRDILDPEMAAGEQFTPRRSKIGQTFSSFRPTFSDLSISLAS